MNENCNLVDYSSEQLAARERLAKMWIKLDDKDINATAWGCEKNLGRTHLYLDNSKSSFVTWEPKVPQAPVFDPNVSLAPSFDWNSQKISANKSWWVDVKWNWAFAQWVNTHWIWAQTNIWSRWY